MGEWILPMNGSQASEGMEERIVASIRRIIRAIDLQSRRLLDRYHLTGPQLATLREASRLDSPSTSALARAVHLSQPTVSGILNRLEARGLIRRERSTGDRRTLVISVTPQGERLLEGAPSLLQDRFHAELARLEDWERHWLLSALERIASMMDAEAIDAAPILQTGPLEPAADESAAPGSAARPARPALEPGSGSPRGEHSIDE